MWAEREDQTLATLQETIESLGEKNAATFQPMIDAQLAGPTSAEAAAGLSALFPSDRSAEFSSALHISVLTPKHELFVYLHYKGGKS